jgi:hypothetical protein
VIQEQPESIEPRRFSFGPLAYVAVLSLIVVVVTSLLFDGGLARVAVDFGTGLGAGLAPVVVVGILASIGFVVLGLTNPSGDEAPARAEDRRPAIGLEDLPPLIDVGRWAARSGTRY